MVESLTKKIYIFKNNLHLSCRHFIAIFFYDPNPLIVFRRNTSNKNDLKQMNNNVLAQLKSFFALNLYFKKNANFIIIKFVLDDMFVNAILFFRFFLHTNQNEYKHDFQNYEHKYTHSHASSQK